MLAHCAVQTNKLSSCSIDCLKHGLRLCPEQEELALVNAVNAFGKWT